MYRHVDVDGFRDYESSTQGIDVPCKCMKEMSCLAVAVASSVSIYYEYE